MSYLPFVETTEISVYDTPLPSEVTPVAAAVAVAAACPIFDLAIASSDDDGGSKKTTIRVESPIQPTHIL